ncbi:MAG: hypothetical protein ACJAVK_000437 [Akkermansiaceae bacterium]|jgi:hypothetical protein
MIIKALLAAILTASSSGQTPWPATDHLGRSLPLNQETGPIKKDRTVGIFYFVWLGAHSTSGPHDLTKIMAKPPHKMADPGVFHHWGEPESGYYYARDPYILRRHATLLSDAGVDFIALDITNAYVYNREVEALCQTWLQMRKEGFKTPQITFLANSSHVRTVDQIYKRIYKPGKYKALWFHWQGKPLMMANPEGLSPEQKSFFTLRRSWAWSKGHEWFGNGKDKWPWLDHTPQTPGWHTPGTPEFVSVAAAQHPISNIGRSHQNKIQPAPGKTKSSHGLYFQEQWDHALKIDPKIIFITGWNEWVAQRFLYTPGKGAHDMTGRKLKEGESYFVDCFSMEFSRDIEPMKGGYQDAYYSQMVANIRRYKGTPALPKPLPNQTITIDGKFDDWKDALRFNDPLHDTHHRDHEGWAGQTYTETSGRNDFANLRVATQKKTISFLLHTRAPLTESQGDNWMILLLDSDQNPSTGWHGYDSLLNRTRKGSTTSLEKLDAHGKRTSTTFVPIAFDNNMLEIQIPRLPEWSDELAFDFHAADNAPFNEDFFTQGDHAPNRRFNYRFQSEK